MSSSNNKGFTITEVTIALALLSVAITGAVATFVTLSRLHQKTIVIQDIQQQASFVVESIERDLSNGSNVLTKEQIAGMADDGNPANDMLVIESGLIDDQEVRYFTRPAPGGAPSMLLYRQVCMTLTFDGGSCSGAEASMTSDDVTLTNSQFKFVPADTSPTDAGYVTLSFAFEKNEDLLSDDPNFKSFEINSLVSLRN